MLRVGVGPGVAASGAYAQPGQVELPALAVMVGLFVVGQVVVAQDDAGAAVLDGERHLDPGRSGWDVGVVGPAPGEHEPVWWVEFDELAGRRHAVAHADP